ncbi:MAG: hypothetical protein HC923_03550 [Myxococcales bacterium]|nr:hypothetical protein [Myxococcales bacterium]
MQLSKKLSLGFGAVLALLVISCAVALQALWAADRGFKKYQDWEEDANVVGRAQAALVDARTLVKDYVSSSQDSAATGFREKSRTLDELMDEADQRIQNPERKRLVASVKASKVRYGQTFDQVEQLTKKRNVIVNEQLPALGGQSEQILTELFRSAERDNDLEASIRAAQSLRSLLLARLHVMKLLYSNDASHADRVRSELSELKKLTQASTIVFRTSSAGASSRPPSIWKSSTKPRSRPSSRRSSRETSS